MELDVKKTPKQQQIIALKVTWGFAQLSDIDTLVLW